MLSGQSACHVCAKRKYLQYESLLDPFSDREQNLKISDVFAGLGTRPIDWFFAVESDSSRLYPVAIQESIEILENISGKRIGYHEGEILFGHLAHLLAMRISRAAAQLGSSGVDEICDVRLELSSHPPISSQEASNLISSPRFGGLVEFLVAMQRGISINSASYAVAPAADPAQASVSHYTRIHNLLVAPLRAKARKGKVLIVSPYIGKFRELALKFAVQASPIFFEIRPKWAQPTGWALAGRRQPLSSLNPESLTEKEILHILLLECLPSALIEHVEATLQVSVRLGFPSNPTKVFTSNAFDSDDVFKVYLASVRNQVSYLVGQHGNNYGVARFTNSAPEVKTADAFLSWGWQGANVLPLGQLKPLIRPARGPFCGVLLMLRDKLRSFTAHDADYTFEIYLDSVFSLAKMLSSSGVRVTIRSHPNDYGLVSDLFIDACAGSSIILQPVGQPLDKALERGLAPVFCYDSTGVLEAATAGGEFFIFAPDGIEHVEEFFRPNYNALKLAGLLAEEASSATTGILAWLTAKNRRSYQQAIERFADGLVKPPPSLLMDLIRLLRTVRPFGGMRTGWTT